MNATARVFRLLYFVFGFGLLGLGLTGCKSTPFDVDWNNRIGSYSYDQAVMDLGPPDTQEKLANGQTVAEWFAPRNTGVSMGIGTGVSADGAGIGMNQTFRPPVARRVLRLTFGLDQELVSVTKNY